MGGIASSVPARWGASPYVPNTPAQVPANTQQVPRYAPTDSDAQRAVDELLRSLALAIQQLQKRLPSSPPAPAYPPSTYPPTPPKLPHQLPPTGPPNQLPPTGPPTSTPHYPPSGPNQRPPHTPPTPPPNPTAPPRLPGQHPKPSDPSTPPPKDPTPSGSTPTQSGEPSTLQIDGHGSGDLKVPKGTTHVKLHINVDQVTGDGLNFFGLQVNFNNKSWAHGGVQKVDGKRKANWGGLPVRNDGQGDYSKPTDEQQKRELERIQNGGNQVEEIDWKDDTEYVYEITRSPSKVKVPAGDARVSSGDNDVNIDHDREMYEWHFTVRPANGGEPVYDSTMYNSAESIDDVFLWNETGYGADEGATHATWGNFEVGGADGKLTHGELEGHSGAAKAGNPDDLKTDPGANAAPEPAPAQDDENIFQKGWHAIFG